MHEHEHHGEDVMIGGDGRHYHPRGADKVGPGHHHEPEIGDGAELVVCPVMPHNLVNIERAEAQGLFRDFKSQRYWLCRAACGRLRGAQPDKYAAA